MGRTRRGFTPEYKDEAVKLVINTGRSVATVARELGVQESTLGRWVHDFKARAVAGEAGQGGLSLDPPTKYWRVGGSRLMLVEKSNFTVTRMVRLLGVSRSGFYAWLGRDPSQRAIRAERIEAKVAWFHGDSDEVSGSPKILADLRGDGEVKSRKTVAKTMRKLGLVGVCPRRWKTTTLINHADAYPVDAAKRDWDKGELNRVWVGDITYLRTWEGWLYLATVIDAHSRRVIGWAIDEHMRADLVQDALVMAITLRGDLPATVVFHSDRGTQYASAQITAFAAANGLIRSMGLTGICWDNAMAESFFATLKTEFYYRRVWPTKKRARVEVGKWIEDRYNRRRRHASLGQISPVDFELQHSQQIADSQEAA